MWKSETVYENFSMASGKVLNLPAQHYVAESHNCKLIAETSLTLEKKGERLSTFFKAKDV